MEDESNSNMNFEEGEIDLFNTKNAPIGFGNLNNFSYYNHESCDSSQDSHKRLNMTPNW